MNNEVTLNEQQEKELSRFHEIVSMTRQEYREVRRWIGEGNSPFTNPYGLIYVSGDPAYLNFIDSLKVERYRQKEKDIESCEDLEMEFFYCLGARYCRLKNQVIPGWDHSWENVRR